MEVSDRLQPGDVPLPNGLGVDYQGENGDRHQVGAARNELTCSEGRDPIAGNPWHKSVPARIE